MNKPSSPFTATATMKAKGVMAKWTVDKLTVKEIEETTEALIKKYGEAYDSIGKKYTLQILRKENFLRILCKENYSQRK